MVGIIKPKSEMNTYEVYLSSSSVITVKAVAVIETDGEWRFLSPLDYVVARFVIKNICGYVRVS